MNRRKHFLILVCVCLFASCENEEMKFEQSKWNQNFDGFYKYRESMVKDLMDNHLKKGMTYDEVIDLIGKPENIGNLEMNTIGYILMEDYGWDIDPVETKTLMIELSKDSLVRKFEVEHWEKN